MIQRTPISPVGTRDLPQTYGIPKPLQYVGVYLRYSGLGDVLDDSLTAMAHHEVEAAFAVEESCCPGQGFPVHA